jgi:transposase
LAKGTLRNKRAELTRAFRASFDKDDARLLKVELKVIEGLEAQLLRLQSIIDQKVAPFDETIALLDTIPGVDRTLAIGLIAEIGVDMSAWPSDGHFAAWTGTCPGNRESAGIRRRARARDGNPYVKSILIQAAVCASLTATTDLAIRYRRLSARRGPRRAAVAVARQIAVSVYHMLTTRQPYRPPRSADPDVARQQRRNLLVRQLSKLGFEVTCNPINR